MEITRLDWELIPYLKLLQFHDHHWQAENCRYFRRKLTNKGRQSEALNSSRLELFCKKDVLKNFDKFRGKHLWCSLQLWFLKSWKNQTFIIFVLNEILFWLYISYLCWMFYYIFIIYLFAHYNFLIYGSEIHFRSVNARLSLGYVKLLSNFSFLCQPYKEITVRWCKQPTSKSSNMFMLYILIQGLQ